MKIVVVGAGIIGLSSALAIVEKYPEAEITVVSREFPADGLKSLNYTTNKSGAHFRPFPSKNPKEFEDSKLARSTLRRFKKLTISNPETSIKFINGYDFIEKDDKLYQNLSKGYTEELDEFQVLSPKDYMIPNIKFGAKYKTFSVYPQFYLLWLKQRLFMRYHVKFIQMDVQSLEQISKIYPNAKIINATGMGLMFNGGYDPKSYPIRGQVLLIRPPTPEVLDKYLGQTITYQLDNGDWSFVIPRGFDNGIILGGTKVVNSSNGEVSLAERDRVVANARLRFPDLFNANGELDILDYSIGLRPAREGGVRLEREVLHGVEIIHAYGFGGTGVEMSWGAAECVASMVKFNSCL